MRKIYITLFVFGTLFYGIASAQTTVTFTPVADNTIHSNITSNSNGLGKLFSGQTCSNGIRRALMKFDVSSIPSGVTITAVSLGVTVDKVNTAAVPVTYNIHPLTLAFGEGTSSGNGGGAAAVAPDATWNDAMLGTSTWATAGGDFSTSISSVLMGTSTGLKTFPSSAGFESEVQTWVNTPASNFGIIMIGDETAVCSAKRFGSKDQGTAPVLTVTYTNCSVTSTDTQTACDTLTWIDGNTYNANNNTATHTITGGAANGCDSIVTLDLTVIQSSMTTDTQTACDSYTWIDGTTYTMNNNTAQHTIANGAANGCDSIVTLNLTIDTVNVTTSQANGILTANQAGASYQWLDCDNGNASIAGATGQTFTPINSGNYAVQVTNGSCVDTSACTPVTVGINELSKGSFKVHPNPVSDVLVISSAEQLINISIYGVNGQMVKTIATPTSNEINVSQLPQGIYTIAIQTDTGISKRQFVKE